MSLMHPRHGNLERLNGKSILLMNSQRKGGGAEGGH